MAKRTYVDAFGTVREDTFNGDRYSPGDRVLLCDRTEPEEEWLEGEVLDQRMDRACVFWKRGSTTTVSWVNVRLLRPVGRRGQGS